MARAAFIISQFHWLRHLVRFSRSLAQGLRQGCIQVCWLKWSCCYTSLSQRLLDRGVSFLLGFGWGCRLGLCIEQHRQRHVFPQRKWAWRVEMQYEQEVTESCNIVSKVILLFHGQPTPRWSGIQKVMNTMGIIRATLEGHLLFVPTFLDFDY